MKMKETENVREELKEMSPLLLKMKAQNDGFQIPANYFHHLTVEMMNQIAADNQIVRESRAKKETWFSKLLNQLQWWMQPRPAMAFASVLVLVVAGFFFMKQPAQPVESTVLSNVSLAELELFFEANIDEYDMDLLVEGNEEIFKDGIGEVDGFEEYYDEIIEESDLEDLL